jgi:hypothetical protein
MPRADSALLPCIGRDVAVAGRHPYERFIARRTRADRHAAEDGYRLVGVSAVANEPRDGVSVAAGLVEVWAQAAVAGNFYGLIGGVAFAGARRGRGGGCRSVSGGWSPVG